MEESMKLVISGATGFIGKHLTNRLVSKGYKIVVLTRDVEKAHQRLPNIKDIYKWDSMRELPPEQAFKNVDAVIHLAGEPIMTPFLSKIKMKKIMDSRTIGTHKLMAQILKLKKLRRPEVKNLKTVISASAVGYYGNGGDKILTENSPVGRDEIAEVCQSWENEILVHNSTDLRCVVMRSGIVLGNDGGILPKIIPIFRLGIGAILGDGKQSISWIHYKDITAMYENVLTEKTINGVINACAPNAISNSQFSNELSQHFGHKCYLKIPAWAIKAIPGKISDLLLTGQKVYPQKMVESGFRFQYPYFAQSVNSLYPQKKVQQRKKMTEKILKKDWPLF